MGIPLKEKACKGTGKAHGHGCGKLTMYRIYGLGKMCGCYSNWLLNTDAGKVKMQKSILKIQKPRIALERAEKDRKVLSELKRALKATKEVIHAFVRERDKGKPCISCGMPWHKDFHAGHFHKAELFETLKFNLDNIHGQCPGCNIFKDGNLEQYNINLPHRIGNDRYNILQSLAQSDKQSVKVWNVESLRDIRENLKKNNGYNKRKYL